MIIYSEYLNVQHHFKWAVSSFFDIVGRSKKQERLERFPQKSFCINVRMVLVPNFQKWRLDKENLSAGPDL